MRALIGGVTIGLIAFGVMIAGPVSAAQPTSFTEVLDDTRLLPRASAACGFDVYQRLVGQVTVKLFSDRDGAVVREVDLFKSTRLIWFAPAKGTSFSYPFNATAWFDYPQGATIGAPVTFTITGFQDKVPGQAADAGRIVFAGQVVGFTPEGIPIPDTSPEPVSVRGNLGPTTFPEICAVLAGA